MRLVELSADVESRADEQKRVNPKRIEQGGVPPSDTSPAKLLSAPVAASNPARFLRATPLAAANSPPTKTLFVLTTSARTRPSVLGAQFGSTVPSA